MRRFHVSVQCPFLSCPRCCVNIRAALVILTLHAAKGRNTIYHSHTHTHTQLVDRSHGEESDADRELGTSAGRERERM